MLETEAGRPDPDLIAMRAGLGTGLGQRLTTEAQTPESDDRANFGLNLLRERGLFRPGEHTDEVVIAKGHFGDEIELQVTPLVIKQWQGTIFVAKEGQSDLLKVLYPRLAGWKI